MNRVIEILFRPFPDEPLRAVTIWANLAIVPLLFMAIGSYRVWVTAKTPFEEFTGTLTVIMFAMMWAMCFGVFADHWRETRKT